jgi:hypothetical protein
VTGPAPKDRLRRCPIPRLTAKPAHLPFKFAGAGTGVVLAQHRLAATQSATQSSSAYDAAYLELALRRSLTLVSLDARLNAAAKGLGHPMITAAPADAR